MDYRIIRPVSSRVIDRGDQQISEKVALIEGATTDGPVERGVGR